MLKYSLVFFSCILIFTDVDATAKNKRVHFPDNVVDNSTKPAMQRKKPSDLKLVMSELERKAEDLHVEIRNLPFDVLTRIIRSYLESKPKNVNGVSDADYFALFEKVYKKIMKTDDEED